MIIRLQGAAGNVMVLQPTKTAMTFCDIDPGRWIDVPANFQKWEEAQPKNLHVVSCEISIYCTVVAIWNQFWSFTISSAASEPSSVFSPKPCRRQYFDFLDYFAETMSPMYLDYFVKTTSPIYNF